MKKNQKSFNKHFRKHTIQENIKKQLHIENKNIKVKKNCIKIHVKNSNQHKIINYNLSKQIQINK